MKNEFTFFISVIIRLFTYLIVWVHNFQVKSVNKFNSLCFILLLIFLSPMLFGQDSIVRPKVGLALSGGGAKGFAHIGVLKVLEEIDFPVDYISGTSMGSIVGGMYAIGYSADEIENIVLSSDWEDLFDDRVERRYMPMEDKIRDGRYLVSVDILKRIPQLPSGMISGQKISAFLSRLTWPVQHIRRFSDFSIPFVCVATDIQTGEAVVLDSGDLAEAIRASMALPTIFTPVDINDHLLVDGGVARNLPAEDLKKLGADIIIGVDVSSGLKSADELQSMIAIMDQAMSFQMVLSTAIQRQLCDILIDPEFGDLSFSDFKSAKTIIGLGEAAARQKLPQLIALRDSLNRIQRVNKQIHKHALADSILITKISIDGANYTSKRLIRTHLGIRAPIILTAAELDEGILRIYGTGLFKRVTYHLEPVQNGTRLRIMVMERPEHQFQFSFRYDTYEKATVLLNTTVRNVLRRGSVLRADMKLSTDFSLNASYTVLTEIPPRLGMSITADYENFRMNLYRSGNPVSNLRINVVRNEMLIGTVFSRQMVSGVGISQQWYNADKIVGQPLAYPDRKIFHSLFGLFLIDTQDKTYFPTRGLTWLNRFDITGRDIRSKISFRRFETNLSWHIPVHPHWTINHTIRYTGMSGNELVPTLLGHLGGHDLFIGLHPYEYTDRYMKMIRAEVQCEWMPHRYLTATWNMGKTDNHYTQPYRFNKPIHGAGLTLGMETFIGPVELSGMTSDEHSFLTYLNIGYKF